MGRQRREDHLPDRRGRERRASAGERAELDLPWRSSAAKQWLLAAALVAAVCLVYQPAWRGGLIWDDDAHVTRHALRSWQGLSRIWFDLGATPQYYPLTHSVFWLEHKLWGDVTLGYHLVNLLLHATVALMLASVLRRLAVPGAWLASAIFALHPVHVESVAWITELKNTLSAVFYLGAAIAYLRFDQTRKISWYLGVIGLFALGLLSKTVVATLPAALLVVFWWQRGRLAWRRDFLPLLPLFLLGAAAGVFTAWVEQEFIGAQGAGFELSSVQRGLIAGRAIWFYLSKLFWPADLTFIYPRWEISDATWWQYLFPLAAVALLLTLWTLRRRTRGPLAAALFFVGTLFPVLGFLNVFPFIYSFVADHFQYLASLGVITLFSAGVALLLKRAEGWARAIGQMGCVALVAVLAVLSSRQCEMYADSETLYRATIARNPDCLMAYNNLGIVLAGRGQVDEAIVDYRKALDIDPDDAEAHNNLGNALVSRGHVDEGIGHYRRAVETRPDYAKAHNNLGNALVGRGQVDEAIGHLRKALEIEPDFVDAHYNLGIALAGRGLVDEAIAHYRKALEIEPDYAKAHNNLAIALTGRGQVDEAIAHFRKALDVTPDFMDAHCNLAIALAGRGQVAEAIAHYRKALDLASAANDKERADFIRAQIRLHQSAAPGASLP